MRRVGGDGSRARRAATRRRSPRGRRLRKSTPPWRARPWSRRRPSRATASAARRRRLRPWRRTRCAGPPARRGNARSRSRRLPSPAARPASWRTRPARPASSAVIAGSTTFRHTEVLERIAGSLARKSIHGVFATQSASTLVLASARAISALRPPTDLRPVQRVEIVLDAQHRRRVDGLAFEDAVVELAALGHAEDLRQRPGRLVALQPRHRARADRISMPCAASPPSAFCQEKVTTSSLAQSSFCANAAEVASQMVRPSRSAVIQSAFGHAHARGGAVPGEDDVGGRIDLGEIGDFAIAGVQLGDVLELQLLDDVGDPAFAEGFPGERGRRAARRAATTAPSRPRRYRTPARCRSGNRPALQALRASDRSRA